MLSVYKTKKLILSALICLLFSLLFGQARSATPGCLVGISIYYNLTSSGTTEVYGKEFYRRATNDVIDCGAATNQNISYVNQSDITTRAGVKCTGYFGNNPSTGTAIEFTTVHQCPIDDYIPYILLTMIPILFYFSRKMVILN
ncbi:hypothetical protein G6M26_22710 [Agrobacterium tumefaciens]|nr:hypothetical protein [Agrobacterium tumefaciens]NTE21353.1 hypothetical protein [Agrobacterium tumefaciens]